MSVAGVWEECGVCVWGMKGGSVGSIIVKLEASIALLIFNSLTSSL